VTDDRGWRGMVGIILPSKPRRKERVETRDMLSDLPRRRRVRIVKKNAPGESNGFFPGAGKVVMPLCLFAI
jgi:hypothetical protein